MKLTQNEKKILYNLVRNEIHYYEDLRDTYGEKVGKELRTLKNITKKIEKEEEEIHKALDIKTRIKKAIKELGLSKEELDIISLGNMDRICESAKVDKLELMYYLRYER